MYNNLMDLDTNMPTAKQALDAAFLAYGRGDQRSARRYAEQAAALAPQSEIPWLLMAVLASPKAARFYLDRAAQAQPGSPRAEAGLRWLAGQPPEFFISNRGALPIWIVFPDWFKAPPPAKPKTNVRYSWLIAVAVLVLVGLAAIGMPRLLAQSAAPQDNRLENAIKTALKNAEDAQASTTPTPTVMVEPSLTHTATITPQPSKTNTRTASPSATASATLKPSPVPPTRTPTPVTYTVKRGDTLNLIAQRYQVTVQDLIAVNELANPSLIMPGQVLVIPSGAYKPPASPLPTSIAVPSGGSGKEIHIDISEQHLYAYENGKLVFSYVVSTGIGNSTRIGTFKILDKIPNAYSSRFNIWMPYWMGIYYSGTLENGIHGLPLLWNGVELWGNLLGQPATYGCIEARTWEIKKLYEWAEIGTPVIIRR